MSKIKTVYDREFESYFRTLYGYLYTAFVLLVAGIYVAVNSLKNGAAAFELSVSNMTFIYLIAIPILTMRVFAEERKQRTEQLLYALPVKMSQVVIGKYTALCVVSAVPVAVMVLYPLVLSMFGTVDIKAAMCALLGFWLLGCTLCSIGMFLSSLTDSQAVAAGASFAVNLLLFFISSLASLVPYSASVIGDILRKISPFDRYYSFLNGIFDIRSIVYMIAVSALFVVLTVMVMEGRRREKKVLYYSLVTVLTLAIIALSDTVIGKLPESFTQIQMNGTGITEFSQSTVKQAESIDKDVSLYWITRKGYEDTYIGEVLEEFDSLSEHIDLIKIDPITQPRFANKFTSKQVNENSVIVECGDLYKYIDYTDIYRFEDEGNISRADFYGESLISSALSYVTENRETIVYILNGHGEDALSDTFISGIQNGNYIVKYADLLSMGKVPDDCQCLLVTSTPSDLTDSEQEAVSDYLESGGGLLLFSTYIDEKTPNWSSLLEKFGLAAQKGIVVEGNANYIVANYPYYILPDMISHEINEDMTESGKRVIVPLTQAVSFTEDVPEGTELYPLLSTSDAAFLKSEGFEMKSTQREDGDITGKFVIASAASKNTSTGEKSSIVWFPSSYILADSVNTSVSGGNLQMLMSCISWITDSPVTSAVQAKHIGGGNLVINSVASNIMSIMFIAVIPLAFIATGTVVLGRRKRK